MVQRNIPVRQFTYEDVFPQSFQHVSSKLLSPTFALLMLRVVRLTSLFCLGLQGCQMGNPGTSTFEIELKGVVCKL